MFIDGANGSPSYCKAVLPAINTYIAQAAKELHSLNEKNRKSLNGLTVLPPNNCPS